MAYTSRKSSFSAPTTVPACHVSPPSLVRTNVPPVPLIQTTLPLTMLNPYRLASVFDFCGCHWRKRAKQMSGEPGTPFSIALGVAPDVSRRAYPHIVSCRAVDSQVTKRKRYAFCPPEHLSVQSAFRACGFKGTGMGVSRQLDRPRPTFGLPE